MADALPPTDDTPRERPTTLAAQDRTTEQLDVRELHEPIIRERADPRDGYEPVPMWLVTLFGVLLFWSGFYLSRHAGDFRADVLDEDPAVLRGAGAAAEGPVDPVVLGEKLYKANCTSCHQRAGQGVPNQYPPLAGSSWVTGNEERLRLILLHGLQGPIEVLGKRYEGNMPAFGQRLSDERIAAVTTYIRQAWGNAAEPITPGSVALSRDANQKRREPWTAAELENVKPPPAPTPPAEPAEPDTTDEGK
ncbi:MAG: cytochrome c [Planctomycetota bacterium]|nr:cytochrome c [Planctomycetota bacterium]